MLECRRPRATVGRAANTSTTWPLCVFDTRQKPSAELERVAVCEKANDPCLGRITVTSSR
jgi:hypothetical protein